MIAYILKKEIVLSMKSMAAVYSYSFTYYFCLKK